MTGFFTTLHIDTKINKNKVEITHSVQVIKKGDIINANQATLLQKLDIVPFFYKLQPMMVYDSGNVFDNSILEVNEQVMHQKFQAGLAEFIALSLGANIPTLPAVPHIIMNSLKEAMGLGVECKMEKIPEIQKMIELLK
jgi:large subunit ribosomal protein LP0